MGREEVVIIKMTHDRRGPGKLPMEVQKKKKKKMKVGSQKLCCNEDKQQRNLSSDAANGGNV